MTVTGGNSKPLANCLNSIVEDWLNSERGWPVKSVVRIQRQGRVKDVDLKAVAETLNAHLKVLASGWVRLPIFSQMLKMFVDWTS